ncbi:MULTISPECIES: sugar transferase [unclassified Variovorax]|jgi:lipopolysaccharide/colanic/teichoic acid biosynthesis glycosyltransferase|uniref:sugar transferase n=1 Tax=unclassified Variovorax TaxID=663243 RepID=UPI000F7D8B89|nr:MULTISPECIES: sugar transferase [unclassified Variovorax]RSZ37264.1 sugar transferase [Variovorax sp. 553]RSZ38078.1 sugar transferase [Variovorax sp. 679]
MNTLRSTSSTGTGRGPGNSGIGAAANTAPYMPLGGAPWLRRAKRTADVLMAGSFFVFFGWAYLLIWLGVLYTSGGPAIYMQPRYGRNGRVFKFYKFRSMVADADAVLARHLRQNEAARREWAVYQKLEHDPRITRFGAFLRKYSIDEFPQFWNVLKGDMSMVGPRPCMFAQKELYGDYWDHYCAVRPGITGLWQISGRNEISYRRRAAMDAEYVAHLSLWRDFLILLKTFGVVTGARGSR